MAQLLTAIGNAAVLLENGAAVNHPLPDTGETPLHSALCKANRPVYDHVVEILLAHGANPNCVTKPLTETGGFICDCRTRAETPLHRAAAFGSERSIQLLLDAGQSASQGYERRHAADLGELASPSACNPEEALLWTYLDSSGESVDV